MEIICPKPRLWNEIYQRLVRAAENNDPTLPKPPVPLILGGWWASSDYEKKQRWSETLEWAAKNGFVDLVGELPDSMMHKGKDLLETLLPLLSLPDPYELYYNRTPRPKLSPEEETSLMKRIIEDWQTIGGPIAEFTRPLRLTGTKRRRLLVLAEESSSPPWGSWNELSSDKNRRAFTDLRQRVNKAIVPHEVDHIDFVHRVK